MRLKLQDRYPPFSEYLSDEVSNYYTDFKPESLFVAEAEGCVVEVLLESVNTNVHEEFFKHQLCPYLFKRCLAGIYGWPGWLPAITQTELASKQIVAPKYTHR